ncbi:hypothetical protein CYPRO_0740 [Cyclonatronum proteinivorum]|uniref:Uncharacterized protein n=1 Tax=Cyclonatronum proteinivorum TaxID=1457365 RepID=A0A345UHS2_9BACT|nr:hypothetical protein CYPRO_0740 [Cyclonatronum proteinivorum]
MEYVVFIGFILIMISGHVFKNKLSLKSQFLISLITGILLIIWFFTMNEGVLFYQLLITAAVICNLVWQIYRLRKNPPVSESSVS